MINYNLREKEYKNHPLEYKWGFLIGNPIYQNHLCTVVDNHNEVINGRYTHEPAKLLLHMSPNVRKYVEAKLFDEFLYVSVWNDKNIPTYTNWEYTYKELAQEEIIENLESVLYDLEPMLQTRTCMGYKGEDLFDNPNYFTGRYVLNDEEEYLIWRHFKDISFSKNGEVFYEGTIDEERFRKAVEKDNLKRYICCNTEKLLNEGELEKELEKYLKL